MKPKIFILLAFCLFCAQSFAQINSDTEKITSVPKYQPHAFGIEVSNGISVCNRDYHIEHSSGIHYGFDVGFRYTWNFLPYVGLDAKLKTAWSFMDFQPNFFHILTGIRASTPRFGSKKNVYVYGAFRLGGALYFEEYLALAEHGDYERYGVMKLGFTCEFDFGIHFKHFFFGPKYSYLDNMHHLGVNVGVDIGKLVEINKKK